MIILINFETNPFKIQYKSGLKSFVKQFPVNTIVAMKDLRTLDQITNEVFLTKKNVTIWDYENNVFLKRSASTPSGNTLPYMFIGNNSKPSQFVSISDGYSGTTTASGMTFVADAIQSSTVFGFITSANTVMANGTISATTIGNNRYISFSGTSLTTANWYAAVLSGATLPAGVTITGSGAAGLGAGSTFYLSATTSDLNSGYAILKRMV